MDPAGEHPAGELTSSHPFSCFILLPETVLDQPAAAAREEPPGDQTSKQLFHTDSTVIRVPRVGRNK